MLCFLVLCLPLGAVAPSKQRRQLLGYSSEDIATLSTSVAASVAPYYLGPTPPLKFVELADEAGWNVASCDLIKYNHILAPIVLLYPAFVPALAFLAATLLAVNAILTGKILAEPVDVDAMKHPMFPDHLIIYS